MNWTRTDARVADRAVATERWTARSRRSAGEDATEAAMDWEIQRDTVEEAVWAAAITRPS
jgi:hypothetical protein